MSPTNITKGRTRHVLVFVDKLYPIKHPNLSSPVTIFLILYCSAGGSHLLPTCFRNSPVLCSSLEMEGTPYVENSANSSDFARHYGRTSSSSSKVQTGMGANISADSPVFLAVQFRCRRLRLTCEDKPTYAKREPNMQQRQELLQH